jgi:DNA mismatch repair protein MutS
MIPSVNNYCIAVKEQGDDIVFLRKIVKGGADKSYGIQVAKLAGVPDSVIMRAKEIVAELSNNDISMKAKEIAKFGVSKESFKIPEKIGKDEYVQMSLFDAINNDDIIDDIKNMDLTVMTPIDALNALYKIQDQIKNRW